MNPQISVLVPYSVGLVAANKPLNSKDIEVTPIEVLPMLDGEVTDNLTTTVTKGKGLAEISFESTTRSSVTLTATWLPFSSNRKTAPDVRRGEKVMIYRFGDADKYYWKELEYDGSLRKKETIIISISNTDDESADPDADNTYFFTFSTHTKEVSLHTSTSDGEPVGYDFIFNTKDGNVLLTDTNDNSFYLDSTENQWIIRTGDDAYMALTKKDIELNAPGNILMKAGGTIGFKSGGTSTWDSGGNFLVRAPVVAFNTPTVVCSDQLITGKGVKVGASLELNGGMTTGLGGGESGGGNIVINGNITNQGNFTSSGSGTFSGRVKASNIN